MNKQQVLDVLNLIGVKELKEVDVYSSLENNKFLIQTVTGIITTTEENWNNTSPEDRIVYIYYDFDPEYDMYEFLFDGDVDEEGSWEDTKDNTRYFLGTISKEDLIKNGIQIFDKEEK